MLKELFILDGEDVYKDFFSIGKKIVFKSHYNEPLDKYIEIISKHTELCFEKTFYNTMHYGCTNRESIFNFDINYLPDNLITIEFGFSFNKNVFIFPSKLINLSFGYSFNKELLNLPNCVENIFFGDCFNKRVIFPTNLKSIYFGKEYNHDINGLPDTLEYLFLGNKFIQSAPNLPTKLKHLTIDFGLRDDSNFNIFFPISIRTLHIINCNSQSVLDNLSNNLKELILSGKINSNLQICDLPTSLKRVIIKPDSDFNADLNSLPDFVEYIEINNKYQKKILKFPKNLKEIKCSIKYKYIKQIINSNPHIIITHHEKIEFNI